MAEFDLEATMRDGTVLRADAYRPNGDGPWPVLLARTPYGKQNAEVLARLDPFGAARRGYLVVIQDCRGRFRSDGQWAPMVHESTDGYDTIGWAATLPGADGRVATYGPSYLGHVQWAAISALPPALCAAVPEFTWSDPDDGLIRRGGADELALVTHWTLTLGVNLLERRRSGHPDELRERLAVLNTALDGLATGAYWALPADQAPTPQRLGLPMPITGQPPAATARVPTLTVAGWFDAFLQGSIDNHVRARGAGAPAALIVGPWSHESRTTLDGGGSLLARELDWLDRQLRPELAAPVPEPPVLLFVMGTNEWRHFPAWPPESIDTSWYLRPGGKLSPYPPEPDSPPDTFRHDPSDPVPTRGGALLMGSRFPAGPCDQGQIEERADVLVYTSEPLQAPLEVIGRISVRLVAESTTPDTDWVARLCDVDPDGVSRNITDGIRRTRRADRAEERLIDLWSTAHVFPPGHRIRVQLASSCFPRWDSPAGQKRPARHTVYHDAAKPSRLILPVAQAAIRERSAP